MDKAYNPFSYQLALYLQWLESTFSTCYFGSGPPAVLLGQTLYPYARSLYALALWYLPMQPIKCLRICSHLVA